MSWKQHHEESEGFASQADLALRQNELEAARQLYARAAACEERAVADLDKSKKRTLGISVVSAASLHYKSKDFSRAQTVAYRWLAKKRGVAGVRSAPVANPAGHRRGRGTLEPARGRVCSP